MGFKANPPHPPSLPPPPPHARTQSLPASLECSPDKPGIGSQHKQVFESSRDSAASSPSHQTWEKRHSEKFLLPLFHCPPLPMIPKFLPLLFSSPWRFSRITAAGAAGSGSRTQIRSGFRFRRVFLAAFYWILIITETHSILKTCLKMTGKGKKRLNIAENKNTELAMNRSLLKTFTFLFLY